MQKAAAMKSDSELKAHVTAELEWDPEVELSGIRVAAQDGVVTLSGTVNTAAEMEAVQRAVRRVGGVRGIALELDVQLAPCHCRSDTEIAQAALAALRWHASVPEERIQVSVDEGVVTLAGEVDWAYQRASADEAMRHLVGVRQVVDRITVSPRASAAGIEDKIRSALTRHAERVAQHIHVSVEGGVVTLDGEVETLAEHDAALGTAFSAPGVSRVVDHLRVAA
jgi:osmotically-inducible protein OsmY